MNGQALELLPTWSTEVVFTPHFKEGRTNADLYPSKIAEDDLFMLAGTGD